MRGIIIGMVGAGSVIFGGGLPRRMMADEDGVIREAEPVVWQNPEAMPEFRVVGYALDSSQAVEIAHQFGDFCGRPFSRFDGSA